MHIYILGLKLTAVDFSNPFLSYLHEVVRTNFSTIFLNFRNYWRHFSEFVAPPSEKPEKKVTPEWKSIDKERHNSCSKYIPPERTRLGALYKQRKEKRTPHFRTYSRRALCNLPQTLHGERARRDHQKGAIHLSIQRIVFSYRVHGEIWPNWRTRSFSTKTP